MPLPHIRLLGRPYCGLCDEMKLMAIYLAEQGLCSWESVDIDRDPALKARYNLDVPVLLIDGRERAKHHIELAELRSLLQAAAQGDT